jgi:hypothetical protein
MSDLFNAIVGAGAGILAVVFALNVYRYTINYYKAPKFNRPKYFSLYSDLMKNERKLR